MKINRPESDCEYRCHRNKNQQKSTLHSSVHLPSTDLTHNIIYDIQYTQFTLYNKRSQLINRHIIHLLFSCSVPSKNSSCFISKPMESWNECALAKKSLLQRKNDFFIFATESQEFTSECIQVYYWVCTETQQYLTIFLDSRYFICHGWTSSWTSQFQGDFYYAGTSIMVYIWFLFAMIARIGLKYVDSPYANEYTFNISKLQWQ